MIGQHKSGTLEIGVDEAGRGPLFGRVYAGAVIWPPGLTSPLIKDSKKLRPKQLTDAYQFIKENAISYAFAYADEREIEKYNILRATMMAMHRAIAKCQLVPDLLLIDGDKFESYLDAEGNLIPHLTIESGDDKYYAIAAASIIAKWERDHYIDTLCAEYPELDTRYQLLSNKGYGSVAHRAGIDKYGISQFHRKTFGCCKDVPVSVVAPSMQIA